MRTAKSEISVREFGYHYQILKETNQAGNCFSFSFTSPGVTSTLLQCLVHEKVKYFLKQVLLEPVLRHHADENSTGCPKIVNKSE